MRKLLLFLLLAVSLPLAAQTPYLIKDINTTSSNNTKSSLPSEFTEFGGRIFFVATTDAAGTEIWSSDGSSSGTSMISDIIPGAGSSTPSLLQAVNGVLLFDARDVNHGIELWTTDGTAAGTRLLTDINPGPTSSQPGPRILYKNRLLFAADDGTNGRELWSTDGTAAGTRMIKDISPGSGSSNPGYFVILGDNVYFLAANGLWKTDGTDAGTVKVASVSGRNLAVSGSKLFFEGFTSATSWELWVSDGSDSGTHMVTEILSGAKGALDSSYYFLGLTPFHDGVLFPADDGVHGREMWFSDGTAAGTRLVRDLTPGAVGTWDSSYAYITAFGNHAYFVASDQDHGREVWVTDGTDAGTSLFADLIPGPASSYPYSFVVSAGKLYFLGASASVGSLLWVTDGTVSGAQAVSTSLGVTSPFGASTLLWPAGGKVYFAGTSLLTGGEPWVSDGTGAGTHLIANLLADRTPSSDPHTLTAAGNLLFFIATEGLPSTSSDVGGTWLWRTDGTDAGTVKVLDNSRSIYEVTPTGGPLVFIRVQGDNRFLLLMSDGTAAGTKSADDFQRRFGNFQFSALFPFGDKLFAAAGDSFETSLWITTPTPEGTALSLGPHIPAGMIDFAGKYAFYAEGPRSYYSYGLWLTDGTPAGTYAVVPDLGDTNERPSPLVIASGTLFFLKTLRDGKLTLWKSDGTADGTEPVKEFAATTTFQTEFKAAGRNVFIVTDGSLWSSDGTAAGTIELTKVTFIPSNERDDLRAAGNRIVYVNNPSSGTYELWGSDGTKAGTKLLKSLGPYYTALTSIDGVVYFAGVDDAHGNEIWTTDGTVEGTKLLIDLNPGPASSGPSQFTKVGDRIYFTAYTDATGGELWALPLTTPTLSIAGTHGAEGDAATAVMHFNVSLTPAAKQAVTVDYATSDGTAKAGSDYDAVSGTITFAPGETSKTIDVRIRGDVTPENNETFLVTLRNASGAVIANPEAFGIIDDDDQIADVSAVSRFEDSGFGISGVASISNAGPRAATDIHVNVAITPALSIPVSSACFNCSISQLNTGSSVSTIPNIFDSSQQAYVSATASARQRDPQSANNTAAWTENGAKSMGMNAPYLTPGGTATVTTRLNTPNPAITSSDPSVVSVPGSVTNVSSTLATFVVTALKPGTSTISVQGNSYPLLVTVVATGTQPRWPGGVTIGTDFTALTLDKPLTVTVTPSGTAPFTSAKATGTVVVTVGSTELARTTVSSTSTVTFPVYLRALQANAYAITYSGDSNFLPQTVNGSVFLYPGQVTITGGLERTPGTAGTYTLTVHAAGSPAVAPTGTLSILNGAVELTKVTLVPSSGGISTAHATLTNLSSSPTLTINYLGDALYQSGSQQVRVVESRQRSARH